MSSSVFSVILIWVTFCCRCCSNASPMTSPLLCSQLKFQADLQITHMYSGEGEEVELLQPVKPSGNVENWLRDVERSMKASLRDNIHQSLLVYPEVWQEYCTTFGPVPTHLPVVTFLYIVFPVF